MHRPFIPACSSSWARCVCAAELLRMEAPSPSETGTTRSISRPACAWSSAERWASSGASDTESRPHACCPVERVDRHLRAQPLSRPGPPLCRGPPGRWNERISLGTVSTSGDPQLLVEVYNDQLGKGEGRGTACLRSQGRKGQASGASLPGQPGYATSGSLQGCAGAAAPSLMPCAPKLPAGGLRTGACGTCGAWGWLLGSLSCRLPNLARPPSPMQMS